MLRVELLILTMLIIAYVLLEMNKLRDMTMCSNLTNVLVTMQIQYIANELSRLNISFYRKLYFFLLNPY